MKEHAYMLHVKSFPQPAVVCVAILQPLPGSPDSPTQPIAATRNSHSLRRTPAAPPFTPYSPDPISTGSKPRWKLPLRTHPSLAAGASRAWAKAPTLQLPQARLRPQPPLKADSLFSVTHRDSCAAAHMPKEVLWHSFQVSFWKWVFRRRQPAGTHPSAALPAPQGNATPQQQQHSTSGQHV